MPFEIFKKKKKNKKRTITFLKISKCIIVKIVRLNETYG